MIRVLLVDDQPRVRAALAIYFELSDDMQVVGQAGDGHEALARCGELLPDVVLMDLLMPGMDGISTTRQIHQLFPRIQVIALTSSIDLELEQAALKAGASKVVSKFSELRSLVAAIYQLSRLPAHEEALFMDDGKLQPLKRLYARRLGCLEKRAELYGQLEHLRKQEVKVIRLTQETYLDMKLTAVHMADAVIMFRSFRNEHAYIFVQLQQIRLEIEQINQEIKLLS